MFIIGLARSITTKLQPQFFRFYVTKKGAFEHLVTFKFQVITLKIILNQAFFCRKFYLTSSYIFNSYPFKKRRNSFINNIKTFILPQIILLKPTNYQFAWKENVPNHHGMFQTALMSQDSSLTTVSPVIRFYLCLHIHE